MRKKLQKYLYPFSYILIFAVLYLVVAAADILEPKFSQWLLDHTSEWQIILSVSVIWGIEYVMKRVVLLIRNEVVIRYQTGVIKKLQHDFIYRVFRLPGSEIERMKTSELVSRQLDDGMSLNGIFCNEFVETAISAVIFVAVFILLAKESILIAVIVMVLVVLNGISEFWFPVGKIYKQRNQRLAKARAALEDSYEGNRVVKMAVKEKEETAYLDQFIEKFLVAQAKRTRFDGFRRVKTVALNDIGTLLIVVLGAVSTYHGVFSLGTVTMILLYYTKLTAALTPLINFVPMLRYAKAALERVEEIWQVETEDESHTGNDSLEHPVETVAFKNVSYDYGKGRKVLDNASVQVSKGEFIALVGGSGSGKSTIVKLLPQLISGYEGEIQVNGKDIHSYDYQELRKKIAYMDQNGFLFAKELWDNLLYYADESEKAEAERYIAQMGLAEIVKENTAEGESENQFSGGEKQRLCMIRELLKKADVIILDEFTSALDADNERIVTDLILREFKDKIIIMVAHKLALVQNADRVYVMDNGKVVEFGNVQELRQHKGRFYELEKIQYTK